MIILYMSITVIGILIVVNPRFNIVLSIDDIGVASAIVDSFRVVKYADRSPPETISKI